MLLRECKCGAKAYNEEDLELFVKTASCKHGRRNQCKECGAKATRKSAGFDYPKRSAPKGTYNNPAGQARWRRYKVNEEMFQDMVTKAGGACEICGDKSNLVIDHCHNTEKVRGILCRKCNSGLGFFRDSVYNLGNAMVYLKA